MLVNKVEFENFVTCQCENDQNAWLNSKSSHLFKMNERIKRVTKQSLQIGILMDLRYCPFA